MSIPFYSLHTIICTPVRHPNGIRKYQNQHSIYERDYGGGDGSGVCRSSISDNIVEHTNNVNVLSHNKSGSIFVYVEMDLQYKQNAKFMLHTNESVLCTVGLLYRWNTQNKMTDEKQNINGNLNKKASVVFCVHKHTYTHT